jgi:hypothetical protein
MSIESELVAVMERWYAVKAARISDVRLKYNRQIEDLETANQYTHCPTHDAIIATLQTNMEAEIASISRDIDEKRKEDIRLVRDSFRQ